MTGFGVTPGEVPAIQTDDLDLETAALSDTAASALRSLSRRPASELRRLLATVWGSLLQMHGAADPVTVRVQLRGAEHAVDVVVPSRFDLTLDRLPPEAVVTSPADPHPAGAYAGEPDVVMESAAHGRRLERCAVRWRAQPQLTAWRVGADVGPPRRPQLLTHLDHALQRLVGAPPDAPLSAVLQLPPAEWHEVVVRWNETETELGPSCTIPELVLRQIRRTPDAEAVRDSGGAITFAQLSRASHRLAHRLLEMGVGPGDLVPTVLSREPGAVAVLLGVMLAGGAYVPVDPALPEERMMELLERVGSPLVVVDAQCQRRLSRALAAANSTATVLEVATTRSDIAATYWPMLDERGEDDFADRLPAPDPNSLAYLMFTSGSTGEPKGVLMTHAPVVNTLRWVNQAGGVEPSDQILFVTSFGFDLSVYDLFGVLSAGGCVRMASEAELGDPDELVRILGSEPITLWDSAPAALVMLNPLLGDAVCSTRLRLVLLSGDWVPLAQPAAIRRNFPRAELIVLGGATEAAIWSNFYHVESVDPRWRSIPYGRPIANARYYVLDERMGVAPMEVDGDLYIGGPCLARAYHNDPELTAARFVPDFFVGGASRLYRTGDRARWRRDGYLEFLGRNDDQVKLRGFRIELGEVETALARLPRVRAAAAAVGPGDQLVGFVVGDAMAELDLTTMRETLTSRLPAYMVPSRLRQVARLPISTNGKLDRKALRQLAAAEDRALAEPVFATAMQARVAEVWSAALDGLVVGPDDEFFDVGGHSLLVTRIVARLRRQLGIDIPARVLLDHSRLADFAAELDRLRSQVAVGGGN